MDKSVNQEKLQKLKKIYTIIGNKFDNKVTDYNSETSEDTNSVEYQKFKDDVSKNPTTITYGESGDYICENVTFEFFREKYYDILVLYEEYTFVVDERDGAKYPSGSMTNDLVVDEFTSLELNDNKILGKWTLANGEDEGTFVFNIDNNKPNTIFFEVTNGKQKKFNATVEISKDKFNKVKEILNDF
jgi:hypothetical protein